MSRTTVIGLVLATVFAAVAPAAAAPVGQGTPKGKLAAYGYHLYGEYCLACHGANAAGHVSAPPGSAGFAPGRVTNRVTGIAPSLQGVGPLAADFYLRTGYMPLPHLGVQPRRGHVLFSEKQIRALVAYVGTFGGPAIPTPHPGQGDISQGQNLFTEHCSGCHQVVAQGGYVTGAVPPPLEDATDTQIAEAVRIGPYVMPRFTEKDISDAQLNSIIRYVDYAKHPQHPGGWPLGYLGPVPEGLVTWFLAAAVLIVFSLAIGKRLRS